MTGVVLQDLLARLEGRVRSRWPALRLDVELAGVAASTRLDLPRNFGPLLALIVEDAAAAGVVPHVSLALSLGAAERGPALRVEVRDHVPAVAPAALDAAPREGALTPTLLRRLCSGMARDVGTTQSRLHGTTRWFVVPLPAETAVTARAPGAPRVLVVDDNPVNRRVATHMLARLGCQVDTAEDGNQALLATGRGRYDLILMDCQMPGMDGPTATAAIRRSEGRRRTPILACTTVTAEDNRQRCLRAGMDGFLPKPMNAQVVSQAVERWLGAAQA